MPIYPYETKSGKFYYLKIYIGGKQIIKRGFASANDARISEANLLKFYSSNPTIKKVRFECSEVKQLFIDNLYKDYKVTTASNLERLFKTYLIPFFDSFYVDKLNNGLLNLFNDQINKLDSKDEAKKIITLSKKYIVFLNQFGAVGLDSNIFRVYKNKNYVDPTRFDFYTFEEFQQYMSVITNNRDRFIFIALFYLGLRISELRGLQHGDFAGNLISIRRQVTNRTKKGMQVVLPPKTSKSIRDYPMLNIVKNAYQDYCFDLKKKGISYRRTDFILKTYCKRSSLTIGESTIRSANNKYAKLSELRHIKPHEFRHSCASDLINHGFSTEQIATWLGHSSSAVTARVYVHLLMDKKKEIADYYDRVTDLLISNSPSNSLFIANLSNVQEEFKNYLISSSVKDKITIGKLYDAIETLSKEVQANDIKDIFSDIMSIFYKSVNAV